MNKTPTIKEVNQIFIDQGTAVAIIVILVFMLSIYFAVKIWMAKKMDMLTDEQIMMIKMTPRVSEN